MPLTKIEIERLIAAARQRIEETSLKAREETEQTLRDLRDALLTDTPVIDMTHSTSHRMHLSEALGPSDRIAPVLAAVKLSAAKLARKVGRDPSLITKYRSGERPIPEKLALKIQTVTRSEAYPDGIDPSWWKGGISPND